MGGACSTYEARRGAYVVLVGKPVGKKHLEDPGVNGTIILRLNFTKWEGGMDWIDLAQDRGRWRGTVNAIMNLRLP
jgi:hypothetical protein